MRDRVSNLFPETVAGVRGGAPGFFAVSAVETVITKKPPDKTWWETQFVPPALRMILTGPCGVGVLNFLGTNPSFCKQPLQVRGRQKDGFRREFHPVAALNRLTDLAGKFQDVGS